jgi:6-phosphogluconolactonase (cycloisomerase 2 family)
MVVFDNAGRVLSADLGSDRLSVLKLDAARISVTERYAAQPGDGPRQIEFHPDGRLLFVANELNASITCYGYDMEKGKVVGRLGQVGTGSGASTGGVVMAVDPAGEFLYTAHRRGSNGVSMWRIARTTGGLRRLQVVDEDGPRLHEMAMTADGKSLLGVSREDGGVFGWRVHNGQIGRGTQLTSLAAPMSLVAKAL